MAKRAAPCFFARSPLVGDLNRRPKAPGPDLQLENSPIELAYRAGPTGTLPHRKKLQRGDSQKWFFGGNSLLYTKKNRKSPFSVLPSLTNMEGAGSGRGANIYACWPLRVRIPLCTCVGFCCWLFVVWGASRSAQKKASCSRPHWLKLRVWRSAAGRLFPPVFFRCVFRGS